MPFSEFHGNTATLTRLREMIARERFPHALILAGPRGSGKYKLAQMLAKTLNCLERPTNDGLPDFCGTCLNCTRIAESDDLDNRCDEAVEARESMREVDKKETRLFIQSHPDVLVIPPDPPQNLIKVGQVRRVIETVYYRPGDGRERVYIFTDSAFMKEAANSLLKVLEEPPDFATMILLTENPGELLPTIRSRSLIFYLAPLSTEEIEADLANRRFELKGAQRTLVAKLSEGAVGRARSFDLAAYITGRTDALTILGTVLNADDHTALFKVTETFRAGADGQVKTDRLLRAMYTILEDLMMIQSGTENLVRNIDLLPQLRKMAGSVDFDWIRLAAQGLSEVETGMRRNLLRSLSLDSFAAALER
jgi:DNA polymerase III subunit delta'